MNEFLDKLSSYNILNYLFPGVIFVYVLEKFIGVSLGVNNLFVLVFIYYFIGLMTSRVGSLLVEPMLVKIKFIEFAKYDDFIVASQKDPKLETLLEVGNVYRTVIAMILLLAVVYLFTFIINLAPALAVYILWLSIAVILALFLFSYRKQVAYIAKRVNKVIKGLDK